MNIVDGSKYRNLLKILYSKTERVFVKRSNIEIFNSNNKLQGTGINKIFVINLDRQINRWKKTIREGKSQKTENGKTLFDFMERISAVDGKLIKSDNFSSYEVERLYSLKEHFFIDPDPRLSYLVKSKNIIINMSSAEIAVALSHIKAWKKIVRYKIPFTMIMEDDVFFEKDFSKLINKAWLELPSGESGDEIFDLLYLSYKEVDNGAEIIPYSENLFSPVRGFWWLSGYVLSFQGAKKLIEMLPVCGPVDMWMNLQYQNLNVFSSSYSVISQRKDLESSNSYSIMPILSRVGIHLEKKNNDIKSFITRKPIFAIGLNKTGTTSLHFALTLLGYKCCHWISDKFSKETADLIDNNLALPFDAYTDVESVIKNFKKLDAQYPNAVFILTTRDLGDWISSRSRHVIQNRIENSKGASRDWTNIDIKAWIKERHAHHKSIFEYFKDKKNNLLVLDICGGDGWEPLCKFLNLPIPEIAFPNVDPLIKLQTLRRSLMSRVPISGRNCIALEHDDHPWIKRPEDLLNYSGIADKIKGFGTRTGSFLPEITDNFDSISPVNWKLLTTSFPYNLARFNPDNVKIENEGGIKIILTSHKLEDRNLTSGGLRSIEQFQYGRFEIEMKPVKADGLISAYFLYRIDPWQEIDIEFLGNDTSKMLANVYFNAGEEGTVQNYGVSGTPILIELGFDASNDFHHYAIEWDPYQIRWFVDGDLVHVRDTDYPTPIPNLPLRVYANLWAPGNSKLAGKIKCTEMPRTTEIKSVVLSRWFQPETINYSEENIREKEIEGREFDFKF